MKWAFWVFSVLTNILSVQNLDTWSIIECDNRLVRQGVFDKTVLNNQWTQAPVQEEVDPISSFSFSLF